MVEPSSSPETQNANLQAREVIEGSNTRRFTRQAKHERYDLDIFNTKVFVREFGEEADKKLHEYRKILTFFFVTKPTLVTLNEQAGSKFTLAYQQALIAYSLNRKLANSLKHLGNPVEFFEATLKFEWAGMLASSLIHSEATSRDRYTAHERIKTMIN